MTAAASGSVAPPQRLAISAASPLRSPGLPSRPSRTLKPRSRNSRAATKPSPLTGELVQTVRGAASRVAPDATAFAHRALPYAPVIVSQWVDPADADRNVRWTRDFAAALQSFAASGVYVNDLGHDDTDRIRAAYGANYDRLAALKAKYDPGNVFQLNANVKPAA